MIPAFGLGDVLPPFMGTDVVGQFLPRSPYPATIEDVVDAFCTSPERAEILKGLIGFRAELRNLGFQNGFQWIDGSFVENCEVVKGRPPGDVDVISVLHRPAAHTDDAAWTAFYPPLLGTVFDPDWTKANFRCDAYYIDLDDAPISVAELSAYWMGLFSHQRDTFRWKGMVQIPFGGDDAQALQMIADREATW